MSAYFLSDLHILNSSDEIYLRLCAWLRSIPKPGDHVVFAGDLFDLFVGPKKVFINEYQEFFSLLKKRAEDGVLFYFIEGNHDFEHRGAFNGIKNLKFNSLGHSIEIEGKKFRVEHGDLADPTDYGYRALRATLRSLPLKAVIALAPDWFVGGVGRKMQAWSQAKRLHHRYLPKAHDLERIRKTYRNHAAMLAAQGFDFIVMGHCHDLDEMSFKVGDHSTHYMNIGYPKAHGSIVSWMKGETKLSRMEFSAR